MDKANSNWKWWSILLVIVVTQAYFLLQRETEFWQTTEENTESEKVRAQQKWKKRLPGCIIIGVAKCGTRAMLEFLEVHPQIRTARGEVHFFNRTQRYQKGIEWYRSQMPLSLSNQLTIEKSPGYFDSPYAPRRIFAMDPAIKLLLLVRDPVERVISEITNFKVDASLRGHEVPFRRQDYKREISRSRYDEHFTSWLEWFAIEQFHIVNGDNFSHQNPYKELKEVEKFLGLEQFYTPDMFKFNSTKGFYCIDALGKHKCMGDSKGLQHVIIDKKSRLSLQGYYAPHNHKFYEMTGINFHWSEK